MILYTFHRSSASYRIRIALNYKKLAYTPVSINLVTGEQKNEAYRSQNPQGRIPFFCDGNVKIGQSAAILEYLEEKYPEPPLLPQNPADRAYVRYLSQIIISDMHSVMNQSSVIHYLKVAENFSDQQAMKWMHHWLKQGFDAIESILHDHELTGKYCYSDIITIADACLIPQVYNAHKFNFSMRDYPLIENIYNNCNQLDAFINAMPENQFDYNETKV